MHYGRVLELLDEYSLYVHYLGYEPQFGAKYTSPVRLTPADYDDRPSFGVYPTRIRRDVEYMWKDQGNGDTGDIFDLVARLYQLRSRAEALARIKIDFGLSSGAPVTDKMPERLAVVRPQPKIDFKIAVKSRAMNNSDKAWWAKAAWDDELFQFYKVSAIQVYWMTEDGNPKFPRTPGYAYKVWDRFKLYFPHEPADFKFRNDFTDDRYIEGYQQLQFNSDLCIITKALKDVGLFRKLGVESIATRGEHTPLPPELIAFLKSRYKYVATWMDNDGKHKAEMYKQEYGLPMLQVPKESGEKDPTDFHARYGLAETESLVYSNLHEAFGTRAFIRSYIP